MERILHGFISDCEHQVHVLTIFLEIDAQKKDASVHWKRGAKFERRKKVFFLSSMVKVKKLSVKRGKNKNISELFEGNFMTQKHP